jgi:NHL repeat-containing protein
MSEVGATRSWGRAVVAACLIAGLAGAAQAAAEFAAKPEIAGKAITFTVKDYCDVTVAVERADGRIVRHLVSGVLGANPPAPFQKNSKRQTLAWDGKDDAGRPVAGRCRVRVSLGMKPTFAGLIGSEPSEVPVSVRGLATDADGNLYVFHVLGQQHNADGTAHCIVLDRNGKYVKTILPFPADLPEKQLAGLKHVRDGRGKRLPFYYQLETRNLLPGAGDLHALRPAITKDGRIIFAGIHEYGRSTMYPETQLVSFGTDGSVPVEPRGPMLISHGKPGPRPENKGHGGHRTGNVALSPDEKTIYVSGVSAGGFSGRPTHVIYRCTWADKYAKAFIGEFKKPGKDKAHLSDPRGICTDKDGNLYIADHGNDRVAVFTPSGTLLGELPFKRPHRVEVAPDGSLYVLGGVPHSSQLAKFASWKDTKPAATVPLPTMKNKNFVGSLALDATREPRVLWVGSAWNGAYVLLRIEEKDGAFGKPKSLLRKSKKAPRSAGVVMDLALNHRNNTLIIRDVPYGWQEKYYVVKNATSESKLAPDFDLRRNTRYGGSFGLDGKLYTMEFSRTILRFGPDLKPERFPNSKDAKNRGGLLIPFGSTFRGRGRGVTADRRGNIFLLVQKDAQFSKKFAAGEPTAVFKFAPDGTPVKKPVVDCDFRCVASPRLDSQGNIYLMAGLRPGSALLPPGLKGVPAGRKDPAATMGLNAYPLIYGSIVKFGPDGGALRLGKGKGVACNMGFGLPARVEGAKWIVPGVSNAPSWRIAGTRDICLCESTRFDVDGFGRSFFPDAGRFRVGVLDTNGNPITTFGSYGNQDSVGPEIPMWWPQSVVAANGYVFIGDRMNCRVVRVRLDYEATEYSEVR